MKAGKLLAYAERGTKYIISESDGQITYNGYACDQIRNEIKDIKIEDYSVHDSTIHINAKQLKKKKPKQTITKKELEDIINQFSKHASVRINNIHFKFESINLKVASGDLFIAFNDGSESGVKLARIPIEDINLILSGGSVMYKRKGK